MRILIVHPIDEAEGGFKIIHSGGHHLVLASRFLAWPLLLSLLEPAASKLVAHVDEERGILVDDLVLNLSLGAFEFLNSVLQLAIEPKTR